MWELALTALIVIGALLALVGRVVRAFAAEKDASATACGCACAQCGCLTAGCCPQTNGEALTESTGSGAHKSQRQGDPETKGVGDV